MTPTSDEVVEMFRSAVSVPEDRVDLVEATLLIAQAEYPHLDRAAYRARLDEMGRQAAAACNGSTLDRVGALSALMFRDWGFCGNRDDYYDPRNTFLNDVLDRRTGIPITLSLVYIEVGRRAGLPLVGIGMPIHFLVGFTDNAELFVDAFSGGALLARADCAGRLRELQPDLAFRPQFLEPVGPRQILVRMLNNLLEIYSAGSHYAKARGVLDLLLCVAPGEPHWLRSRALVHYHLKNYSRAIADLEAYLAHAPDDPEREELLQHLAALRQLRSIVN